jgi:hypothetical protein
MLSSMSLAIGSNHHINHSQVGLYHAAILYEGYIDVHLGLLGNTTLVDIEVKVIFITYNKY